MSRRLSLEWIARTLFGRGVPSEEPAERAAETSPAQPIDFRLGNGLHVILRPAKGARKIAAVVLFNIGGNHDPAGESGKAHLLEHLYVTAAAGKTPARDAMAWIRSTQGNAQTGELFTIVAEVFTSSQLDARLTDAAARMSQLRIEASDLKREVPRVLAELDNMYSKVLPLAAYNHAREAVRPTPREGRRGGVSSQVDALQANEMQEAADRWYRPANAMLVLAGGFDTAKAQAAIENHFLSIPAGEAPPEPGSVATPHNDLERVRIVIGDKRGGGEATLAYRAPEPGNRDFGAYMLLVSRLFAETPRLGNVSPFRFPPPVSYSVFDSPEVLMVSNPLRGKESPEEAVKRLDRFVAETVNAPLSAVDRQSLENQLGPMLGLVDGESVWMHNPYGLAFSLGRRTQMGLDPEALRRDLDQLSDADLRSCAINYFAADRRSAVVVMGR